MRTMLQPFGGVWSRAAVLAVAALASSCGGGQGGSTGTLQDSGPQQTNLQVQASDADGDTLSYQWRVTGGTVENRNSSSTVWTLPPGPGLHFAYVMVSDGRGGHVEQQYAVSSDAVNNPQPAASAATYSPPAVAAADEFDGATIRLRLYQAEATNFANGSAAAARRRVYLPDVTVQVMDGGTQVFAGRTDLGGEIALPRLPSGKTYQVSCSDAQGVALSGCPNSLDPANDSYSESSQGLQIAAAVATQRNLHLFGHVGLADGGVCTTENSFFDVATSATVQLQQTDGTPASQAVHVNRYGDYFIAASVPVSGTQFQLKLVCDGYQASQALTAPAGGFLSGTTPIELSIVIPNNRPVIQKMVAVGPDGNVRGRMISPLPGQASNTLPGATQFLSYKGLDTKLSACNYYKGLGAVRDCDAQGNMQGAITLDDWLRANQLGSYAGSNAVAGATYVNQRDLNLVRRMSATKLADDHLAFNVCNHPGPDGQTQAEIDSRIDTGLADNNRVACVAMEYSTVPGRNGGKPFTKFFTFAPDGSLLASVNLDQRGEKYMPGTCVACHGGTQYAGRFPEKGNATPYLGANFLPFDTNNYLFSSHAGLGEADQAAAIKQLNMLVVATAPSTATQNLIAGWYAKDGTNVDKQYVPPAWASFNPASMGISATQADASKFYLNVVATSCRTCHAAMRDNFDWDGKAAGATFPRLLGFSGSPKLCGGSEDVAINASMPNALISRDHLHDKLVADPTLAALMQALMGCSDPAPDPAYPKR